MLEKEGSHGDDGEEHTCRIDPLRLPRGCDPARSWYQWSHSYYSRWWHDQGQGVCVSDRTQDRSFTEMNSSSSFLCFCVCARLCLLCLKLCMSIDLDVQVLIGCDGGSSAVAKYLGLSEPKAIPRTVLRGFTGYPQGHPFGTEFLRIRSGGEFAVGRLPVTRNLVHFFVTGPNPPTGIHVFTISRTTATRERSACCCAD